MNEREILMRERARRALTTAYAQANRNAPDALLHRLGRAPIPLPDGRQLHLRTRAKQNPSGDYWFSFGANVRSRPTDLVLFVFDATATRFAVARCGDVAEIIDGEGGYAERPTFNVNGTSLRIRVTQGWIDVSDWLDNFSLVVSAR